MRSHRVPLSLSPTKFLSVAMDIDSDEFNRTLAEQVLRAAKFRRLPWPIGAVMNRVGATLNVGFHTTPMRVASIEIERFPRQTINAVIDRTASVGGTLAIVFNETVLILLKDGGQRLDATLRALDA